MLNLIKVHDPINHVWEKIISLESKLLYLSGYSYIIIAVEFVIIS